MTDAFNKALIAELGKKTSVCWLRYADPGASDAPPRTRAAWHIWHDSALYLVAGGKEQQLPGIGDVDRLQVVMRSKENGGRLVAWQGQVSVIRPTDASWDEVTAALVADRLNLENLGTAKEQWALQSVVVRIDPTGELLEQPGALSTESHAAPPPGTDGTTRGPLPRVLHRRQRRRPGLA